MFTSTFEAIYLGLLVSISSVSMLSLSFWCILKIFEKQLKYIQPVNNTIKNNEELDNKKTLFKRNSFLSFITFCIIGITLLCAAVMINDFILLNIFKNSNFIKIIIKGKNNTPVPLHLMTAFFMSLFEYNFILKKYIILLGRKIGWSI